MKALAQPKFTKRYDIVAKEKSNGATYTPKILADFVAQQIVQAAGTLPTRRPIRVLDPGVGHGELLISLLERLKDQPRLNIEVYGFETDAAALSCATRRLRQKFPDISICFETENFLEFVLKNFGRDNNRNLFQDAAPQAYDLIIANPPYVRTQIMGATQAQLLAERFGLSGRVDLYYAFILGMSQVLKPKGIAGIIVSNRFMTTKSGGCVRKALFERFNIRHAWDLGDTKLFDAAVLPAVLLAEGKNGNRLDTTSFTSIYQTDAQADKRSADPISALAEEGIMKINDGRHFHVQHGTLDTGGTPDGIWRIATEAVDNWLAKVNSYSWGTFRDIGKIRVGVKTCADKVFIRDDWQDMPEYERPELLKLLTTHHIARRFKPFKAKKPKKILYTHEILQGCRKAVDLSRYPRSEAYLERHRVGLEGRKYVIEAGRNWYEIWVPHDPEIWAQTKLVFRDIAEKPTFWIDQSGSIVNGDCYWLACHDPSKTDLLWLAVAVANSTFIERFYDCRLHNKLYAGRRRFITQYVEKFPLPDPYNELGRIIIEKAKQIYKHAGEPQAENLQIELDSLVWQAFGGNDSP